MSEIWHISDHHFGHANMLRFKNADGTPKRDFRDLEHMHAVMVERHNLFVAPQDKVYFHGDVGMRVDVLQRVIPQMNGKKRLILGNHDELDMGVYMKLFQRILAWRAFTCGDCALVCSHFPLHPQSLLGRYPGKCLNVHGHTHERNVRDERYFNVSVEAVDYTPVNHLKLIDRARKLAA